MRTTRNPHSTRCLCHIVRPVGRNEVYRCPNRERSPPEVDMICGATCSASRLWIPACPYLADTMSDPVRHKNCKHSQCQQPRQTSPCGVRAVTHVYCTQEQSRGPLVYCMVPVESRPTRYSRPFKFPGLGHHRGHLPLRCYTHPHCNDYVDILTATVLGCLGILVLDHGRCVWL